jgi:GR25 family glycosyltransferase involved in LPS biosynthesis
MIKYCFYINLEKRTDRKLFIENQLNKSTILKNIYQRFDAVDGSTINPRTLKDGVLSENSIQDVLMDTVTAWGLSMTQGGLGVLMSYLNLFEKISELDSPAITFEDDVEIDDSFDDKLKMILSELPNDFDYCYLGHGDTNIEKLPFSENLSIPKGNITCLPSLIISPNGAKKLIEKLNNIDNQIDTALYCRLSEFKVYVSNERIVKVKNDFTTDIQGNNSCKKNYKKQNYIFATIAHGENANKNAVKLAFDLNFFKQKILIVTDQKELYNSLDNVILVNYPNKQFSYNDKLICFEEGFKHEDAVVYVDSDCRLFYKDYKNCYTNLIRIIEPGFHPSWDWGLISRPSGGFFESKDISDRVSGYGELALDISKKLNIPINDAYHYQEGIIIVSKEENKWKVFLETWKELSLLLDTHEIVNGANKIGVGEGNIVGLSVANSGMKINSHDISNKIGEDIKYNFYGGFIGDYIKNYPDRKTVQLSDGKLISKKNINVQFEERKIDLSYSIFDLNNDTLILNFNWNLNNNVEFLDHEFKINDVIYHFDSGKTNELFFEKKIKVKIFHTYDWYGNKDWKLIDEIWLI